VSFGAPMQSTTRTVFARILTIGAQSFWSLVRWVVSLCFLVACAEVGRLLLSGGERELLRAIVGWVYLAAVAVNFAYWLWLLTKKAAGFTRRWARTSDASGTHT